jgi:diguanylate cyclase (GGDEF)-like protein
MRPAPRPDQAQVNAANLLWQTRYRLLLFVAAGAIMLALKWAGTLSTASVVAIRVGRPAAVGWLAVAVATYFVFIAGLALYVRSRRRVGMWAVAATLAADIVLFHAAVLVGAPPEWYERALILSTFTLQLTLLYFGWQTAAWNLLGVIAAYLAVLLVANELGSTVPLVESMWTLALFSLGMTMFLSLQGDLGDRLSTIVQIFDRAPQGDFPVRDDEVSVTDSGRITVIGAAYDKMRTQLTSVILTDPLTQCFNPRGFDQLSAREISRAARSNASLSLLALDVDHFKAINDTYGHLAGDDVLRAIGSVLRQTARLSDVVARTGGEEFAILAPDTDEEGAAQFAQRVLDAFRGHKFAPLGNRIVTVSVGVACATARTEGVARLLRLRADEALYAAKRGGRNRAERWRAGLSAGLSAGLGAGAT